jgi:hypothetical protein
MNVNETNLFKFFLLPFSPAAESESWRGRSQQQNKINEVTQTDRETVGGNNNKKIHEIRNLNFFLRNIFCSLSLVENTVTQDGRNVKMLTISVVVVVFTKKKQCVS